MGSFQKRVLICRPLGLEEICIQKFRLACGRRTYRFEDACFERPLSFLKDIGYNLDPHDLRHAQNSSNQDRCSQLRRLVAHEDS